MFNFSYKKVGGLRFFKLGRFNLSFSVTSPEKFAETERRRARHSDETFVGQMALIALCAALEDELTAHARKVWAAYAELT